MKARLLVLALLSPALAGCATMGVSCGPASKPQAVVELVFGRNIGDRLGVSEVDWRRFVDQEVTPRFPDGFTVVDGRGQWRDAERSRIVREPSKVLTIVLPAEAQADGRVAEIVAAYKQKFRQQSVLSIVRSSCVSF